MRSQAFRYIGIACLYASIPIYYWLRTGQTFAASDITRPSVIFAVTGVLISLTLGFILRNKGMGIFASVIPATFFLVLFGGYVGPIAILIGVIVLLLIERSIDYGKLTRVISISAVFSLLFPLPRFFETQGETLVSGKINNLLTDTNLKQRPSIWHTVLDGHGSIATLKNIYDIKSEPFLQALKDEGFVIFDNAVTPYNQTLPTMASIFSLEPAMAHDYREKNPSRLRASLGELVSSGPVVNFFARQGYDIRSTKSGYRQLDFPQKRVLETTPAMFNDLESSLIGILFPRTAGQHHNELLRSTMPITYNAATDTPLFLYQHMLAPHPPFTIDAHGDDRLGDTTFLEDGSHYVKNDPARRQSYIEGYREKTRYIQSVLLKQILSIPKHRPVIIIVQGDHGPGAFLDHESAANSCLSERMNTYLAVYTNIPELKDDLIAIKNEKYVTLNLYRTILSSITDSKFEPLEVNPEFLKWSNPWDATLVTDEDLGKPCF